MIRDWQSFVYGIGFAFMLVLIGVSWFFPAKHKVKPTDENRLRFDALDDHHPSCNAERDHDGCCSETLSEGHGGHVIQYAFYRSPNPATKSKDKEP